MKDIKNIVFDFGGVLLDLDYTLTHDAFSALLGFYFDPKDLNIETTQMLNHYEKGLIDSNEFVKNIKALAKNKEIKDHQIIDAWNAMLKGWNALKFDFLVTLRQKYRVFLLSNTNSLHLEWVYEDLKINHGITNFNSSFFEKTYYSHEIGMRKPDLEIYNWVNQDAKLNPSETIFIDDLESNIISASQFGWNTYLHNPKDDLINIFSTQLKLL